MAEKDLKNCDILVMANKQDIDSALLPNDISEKLGMKQIIDRKWFVQGTCGITGEGLKEGLEWISFNLIKQNKYTK